MESDRVRVRIRHVGGDDGRHDGALRGTNDPDVRPRGSTGEDCGEAARRDGLVRHRLLPGLDRLFSGSDPCAMDGRAGGVARFPDGKHERRGWRNRADWDGPLPMDTAQGRLSHPMPDTVPVPDAPRRLSRRFAWLPAAGASPRTLLRRVLLGSNGTFVRWRSDERALDRAVGAACPSGENYSVRPVGCARRWCRFHRHGRMDGAIFDIVMSRPTLRRSGSATNPA